MASARQFDVPDEYTVLFQWAAMLAVLGGLYLADLSRIANLFSVSETFIRPLLFIPTSFVAYYLVGRALRA